MPQKIIPPATSADTFPTSFTDVFLSHNWGDDKDGRDNHMRVGLVNNALNQRHISTWFDATNMHGDITRAMTDGIDNAKVVIVFVTETYIKKVNGLGENGTDDNCYTEFGYSVSRKTPENMITVVMEDSCLNPRDWTRNMGAAFGRRLYFNFCDDAKLGSCIKDLEEEIKRIIQNQ